MELSDFISSMLTYLHLDDDEETHSELTAVVNGSIQSLINSVNSSMSYDDFKNDELFIMALRTLVTQTYYDRELAQGYSYGYLSYLVQLQAKYGKVDDDAEQSN